ncbi:conserved hypothetical protein [Candidatus Koribacter versatilis Ellin345]|uniref:Urate oxidase N-terminal domain-containing protein n=1 Tax=Koribacter versatilis (strain Ellin345) TaxID=204669 RepID=Q1IIF8_KORVE|nr:urate hydroxylase PuuD [Candidatus Koribacter versatilis]ABF43342.1 conserved hypothetical protein [Candidatus Koribacter versatilis Ellin345]
MSLAAIFAITPPQLSLDAGPALLLLLIRWAHFIAGITWVGLLYYFVLVSTPVLKTAQPGDRGFVITQLMPKALFWFRWASVVTVFMGMWYWSEIVRSDATNAGVKPGAAMGSFFGIWTLAFILEMGILMSPAEILKKGPVLTVLMTVILFVATYFYIALNQHGWESNRMLAIGVGGGYGWFMMLNVWGLLWRMQKKIVRWTTINVANGTPIPPEAQKAARLSFLVSRINFVLSFPLLLLMAIASHYPLFANVG